MSAMKFNYREIVRCSNLRRENIIIIIPSNSRETSRSINGMVELEFLFKTNLQMTYLKKKIFSNYCSVLSTIGGPYTWSPPWYPDRCRFPCEPPTGCWLTHQLWSMIQTAADEDSLSDFWKSIFIVNGKVGQQQQQSGLDESGLVELCWVSEYPPGPINILLH